MTREPEAQEPGVERSPLRSEIGRGPGEQLGGDGGERGMELLDPLGSRQLPEDLEDPLGVVLADRIVAWAIGDRTKCSVSIPSNFKLST